MPVSSVLPSKIVTCAIEVGHKVAGMDATSGHAFVVEGDKLLLGARAGIRKEGTLWVCLNGPIYAYRDGSCDKWEKRVRRGWRFEKGVKCDYGKGDDGHEWFSIMSKHGNSWGVSSTGGDTFFDGHRKKSVVEKFDDFEAAKKALAK